MRPLLPALAAPFTETTTDEHECLCLSLSLPSSPLSPLTAPLYPSSFHFISPSREKLSPAMSLPAFLLLLFMFPLSSSLSTLSSHRDLYFFRCVYAPRVLAHADARCSFLTRPFLFCQVFIIIVFFFFNLFISLYTFFPFSYCTF